jgi:two-component system chemotaxis response regulator CheY
MLHGIPDSRTPALPPIVLLVEDDRDTLDMYSTYFESEGVWVASATQPEEALSTIEELKPDLVITDLGFDARSHGDGASLVHTLKQGEATRDIPVIVLTGADMVPAETRDEADLCLTKPVLPDCLLGDVRQLLDRSVALRERSGRALARTHELTARSTAILEKSDRLKARLTASPSRSCPNCGAKLGWIERGRIAGGAEYDYYRWCHAGCGLYCYDTGSNQWVKLA